MSQDTSHQPSETAPGQTARPTRRRDPNRPPADRLDPRALNADAGSTKPGWIRRLAAQCWQDRRLVLIIAAVTLTAVGVDLIAPLLAKAALDRATGLVHDGLSIRTVVIALIVMAVVRYGCQFGRRLTAGRLSINVQNGLRLRLMDTMLHLDGPAQDRIRTGQVVSRSISDLQIVQGLLAMVPLSAGAAIQVVLALGIMVYLSPLLTAVALLIVPAIAVVVARTRRRLFAATWSAQQSAADLAQHVEETVTGVRVVKGFGQEDRAVDDLIGHGRTLFARRMRAALINSRFTPTMAAVPQLGMVAVIAVGGWLTMHGEITPGTFLAFSTYIASMTAMARLLTSVIVGAQLARSAVERVYEVIEQPWDVGGEATDTLPEGPIGVRLSDIHLAHDEHPVLAGVDLTIGAGECVAVVGPPGSGKSTLAELLSRYRRPDDGTIDLLAADGPHRLDELSPDALHRAVGAVFDEPFLYSDSIAANIRLGDRHESTSPAADRRLREAAAAADALGFIEALPDGFDSVVGERGLTLSGGQRQRIALARALYAAPALLVLDDATSAVDALTESSILRRLRADDRTMLVLAHRRSTLLLADRVAVLDEGRIVDIGTVADLDERNSTFRALMGQTDGTPKTATVDTLAAPVALTELWPEPQPEDIATPPTPPALPRSGATSRYPAASGGGPRRTGNAASMGPLGDIAATPELAAAVDALGPATEDPATDTAPLRTEDRRFTLRGLLRPVRWLLALAIAFVAVETLVGLAFPTLARIAIDSADNPASNALWVATAAGVALVLLGWIAGAAMTVTSSRAGERILFGLRVRSYAHLQRLGLDYYERELSGRIMTRMTTDVDALSTFLQTGLSTAVVAALTLVGVSVALLVTAPELGLLVMPVIPIIIVATAVFRQIAARAYTRSRELVSVVNADFQENVAGIKTTQAYGHVEQARARFTDRTLDWVAARMVSQRAISIYFPFITFLSDLAAAAAIAIGAGQIADGSLTAGTLVAFILYLSLLFGPVQQLSQSFDGYQQALVGLHRIADLLRTPSSISSRPDATEPPTAGFTGDIDLDDVGFRYQGAQRPALSEVNLHVPAHGSLALVGATGAGKSTVVKLLARFYDPTAGVVRMDGEDIRAFTVDGYRHRIGLVPQEAHLFSGTVESNIAYGRPDASRESIAAAAAAVGATPMIAELSGGMHHPVGERGQGLSSGQRQLVALARAELVDPDLLLLDEATSTLDQATEAQVLAAGAAVTSRRTSVIVAHRLATAARADQIAVIADGHVVEAGTHEQLLTLNGRYRRLWDAGVDPDVE